MMREVAEENEGTVPPDAGRSLVRINNRDYGSVGSFGSENCINVTD